MQKPFCLVETQAFHLPDDSEFSGVRWSRRNWVWGPRGSSERTPWLPLSFVQVEINMPDGFGILFCPRRGVLTQRVHAYISYLELEGVFIDLELERHDPNLRGAR